MIVCLFQYTKNKTFFIGEVYIQQKQKNHWIPGNKI